ncbi:MAG: hypothetical protein ACFFCT_13945 [Candidatus Odinarchaeota archaeon]
MEGTGRSHRRVILVLFLIVILSPTVLESETFGAGEHIVLDAVFYQTRFEGVCWALEWNSSGTLISHADTFKLLLPYLDPIALLVLMIGFLSPITSWLVLAKRFSFRSGFLIIVLCSILLVVAPSINILRIEEFYTYQMHPLLVPQITSALVLFWYRRSRTYELMK